MKLKRLLLILALAISIIATSFLITSCDDEGEEGEEGEVLEALVLTADKTEIEKNGSVKLTVSFKPEDCSSVFNGRDYLDVSLSNILFYVENDKGTVSTLESSGGVATFAPGKGGSYKVYALYNISSYGVPHLYSNVITVKVHGVRISSAEDLKLLSGSEDGFELTKDIDMGGASWSPIDFKGNFDGQGHKISNFVLDQNVSNLGFFSTLSGTVKNVQFTDVTLDVKSNKSYIGIVAGTCSGVIDSCTVSGTVSTVAADSVGGVVGYISSGSAVVKNCVSYATVEANKNVGGIAGYGAGSVLSCVNEGAVTGNEYVGGVMGYINGTVDGAVNKGKVEARGNRVGGIVGHAISKVNNCENQADVSSQGDYVGGIIGYNEAESFGCENSGNVSGRYRVGGLFGYSSKPISTQENSATVTGRAYIGGIVGECTATLSGCTNKGEIVSVGTIIEDNTERSYVGGLAGRCNGIVNGKNTVDIKANGTRVGGLAGVCYGDVSSSVNEGNVSGANDTGGLVGYGYGNLTSCTNSGIVDGKANVGGIIGYAYSTTKLDGCVNNGAITGSGSYVGGLIGCTTSTLEIIASQNTADITGKGCVGGFVGKADTIATVRGAVNNNVITAEAHVGGIIGVGGTKAALIDCENHGSVLATGAYIGENGTNSYIGGLAGICGSITGGKNTVNISGIADYVGGLAGYCNGSITNSENSGDVVGDEYTGGLAGYVSDNITGSVNNGSVTGTHQTGGLAGNIYDGKIDNSSNYGKVIGKHNVGGIVGHVEDDIEIIYTKNEADVTGDSMVGGFVGFIGSTSSIRNATNSNAITGSTNVGGILGSGANTALYDCVNYGTVTATSVVTVSNLACTYVGGLAGTCGSINNGKNTVDITGNGAYVGGLAGRSGAVSYSQNDGAVKGTDYTGGLAGYINGNATESKNYGSVTGVGYVGGIGGYIYGQKIEKCENYGSVAGASNVGGLCGYENYKNCEISFCKNSGEITGGVCGSLIGYVYNGATIRYSENSGKVNGAHGSFVNGHGGTLKGVIIVTIPADLRVSVNDTVTCELLGISAKEFDTGAALEVTLTFLEGEKAGGSVVTYMAVVSDSYGNTDTFYFDVKIYGTPEISYSAKNVSIKTDPLHKGSLVSFDLNGVEGTPPEAQLVTDEATLKYPPIPVVDGYAFRGWYMEPECINLYDFSADLQGDVTLYAGWEKMVSSGYCARHYVDVLNVVNNSEDAFSIDTANTSSSQCIYIYFTAFTDGEYAFNYKATKGTYWHIYNVTQNNSVWGETHSYPSSFTSVKFDAKAGDVFYLRVRRNYTATCYIYVNGAENLKDGGIDAKYSEIAKKSLQIDARDSFGEALDVKVTLKSGEFAVGQTVVYTITATDSVGNTYTVDTAPILVTE